MHRSRMQYRIQGSRMLTGGKSLFLNLPDKLQEVRSTAVPSSFSLFSSIEPASELYLNLTKDLFGGT